MEPRLLRRGNIILVFCHIERLLASMEPRLLRRGNAVWRRRLAQMLIASMEPRLLRRGNIEIWPRIEREMF